MVDDQKEKVEKPVEEEVKEVETPSEEVVKTPENPEEIKAGKPEKKEEVEPSDSWTPRTDLGKKVKSGEIKDIEKILDKGLKVMEPEIVDFLLPGLETELLLIGQSKGKFGAGQRRVFKQTQKKTREGNKPSFGTMAIVGNQNGYIGIGSGKSKETVPARDKAIRNAKINIIKIRRGSGSWASSGKESNSIPFKVEGRCGLAKIILMPAPKGVGLCVEKECAKMLKIAGIQDVWSKTFGNTKTKTNLLIACFNALKQLMEVKVPYGFTEEKSIYEGAIKQKSVEEQNSNE